MKFFHTKISTNKTTVMLHSYVDILGMFKLCVCVYSMCPCVCACLAQQLLPDKISIYHSDCQLCLLSILRKESSPYSQFLINIDDITTKVSL